MKLKLVDFETAKDLKELGFDWCTDFFYDPKGVVLCPQYYDSTPCNTEDESDWYSVGIFECTAPEQALVVKWFRKTHNIIITVGVNCSQNDFSFGYDWYIWRHSKYGHIEEYSTPTNCPIGEWTYTAYEEAELEGIKKAIEYLKEFKTPEPEL